MTELTHIALPGRALLRIAGDEAKGFLNGLISNDAARIAPDRAIMAALLTPQGKFLFEMLIAEWQGALWLDVAADRAAELAKKLTLYRLRAKVTIEQAAGWQAHALIGDGTATALGLPDDAGSAGPVGQGFGFIDPRLNLLGARVWLPEGAPPPPGQPGDFTSYETLRLSLGVPDGIRDIEIDKGLLLENHFEALNGVDFKKGCYVGQELTARTKYRGLVKKQLYKVSAGSPLPPIGTMVMLGEQEAGTIRSSLGNQGLALLRLEAVAKAAETGEVLRAEGIALIPKLPDYAAQED
jgi:folate-binding protein YgfZ